MVVPAICDGADVSWIGGSSAWVDGNAGDALWNPADEPDADDTARFNQPHEMAMGSNNQIARLEMSSRAELSTAGWDLTVAEDIRLMSGGGVTLVIDEGSQVSAAAWRIDPAASLALQGGRLQLREQAGVGQGVIDGDAYLTGYGVVAADFAATRVAIVNDGIILVDRLPLVPWEPRPTGMLQLTGNAQALIDLDGQSESGIVSVQDNQTLKLDLAMTDAFSGTMNLFVNSRFESQHEWTLESGAIYANNGADLDANQSAGIAYIVAPKLRQTGGTIHVTDGDGRLDVLGDFEMLGGAIVNRGRTVLQGRSHIAAGTVINGGGTLTVSEKGELETATGVTLGINLENNGALRPGGDDAIGNLPLQGFQQTRDGKLFLEMRGSDPDSIDRLAVNAPAFLEGLLNVEVGGAFVPTLGDTFEVLTSVGGVRGKFQQLDVSGMPDNLTFRVLYQPTSVLLQAISKPEFAADFDDDGDVDASDLNVWKQSLGQSAAGDADGDLDTDGADFLHWQRQSGSGSLIVNSPPQLSAAPEPGAAVLSAFAAIIVLAQRRRALSDERNS
ncbi:MAG: hypothetical protein C0485_16535 [Pirellula sp.]|nr:hypothetical protein [Pirellula sp.]